MVMFLYRKNLRVVDALALFGVVFVLTEAFYYQLVLGELPCAFCNLIRVALMMFGAGLALNIRFGINVWNYVLSAFGALIGSLISLLFMFAKAPTYTTPTGSAVMGLHMYTWTFMMCMGMLMYCVFLLALTARTTTEMKEPSVAAQSGLLRTLHPVATGLFVVLVGANLISAFLENGFDTFKSGGQQHYRMLYEGDIMKP